MLRYMLSLLIFLGVGSTLRADAGSWQVRVTGGWSPASWEGATPKVYHLDSFDVT